MRKRFGCNYNELEIIYNQILKWNKYHSNTLSYYGYYLLLNNKDLNIAEEYLKLSLEVDDGKKFGLSFGRPIDHLGRGHASSIIFREMKLSEILRLNGKLNESEEVLLTFMVKEKLNPK